MTGLPPLLAFAVGALTGMLGYGPVKRWAVALRKAFVEQMERPDAQRKDSRFLLTIFATMHPAPWLFILGVPFMLYQLILGPLPAMWLWVLAGILVGVALSFGFEACFTPRSRG